MPTEQGDSSAAKLVALSPREPLSDRIEALREIRDREVARSLCKDELCPPSLRIEALALIDGSNEDDLYSVLVCCVPTVAEDTREFARNLARKLPKNEFLVWVESKLREELARSLLLALWGYCEVVSGDSDVRIDLPLSLVDLLVDIATRQYLDDSITIGELMGSLRIEALAALCIHSFGNFCSLSWIQQALNLFHKAAGRSAAINLILRKLSPNLLKEQIALLPLIICESIESSLLNDDKLKKWNETWYYGANIDTDVGAKQTVKTTFQFGFESLPLLICLERWINQVGKEIDPAVATRIGFVLACWIPASPDEGIVLPWVLDECRAHALRAMSTLLDKVDASDMVFDTLELRKRLSKEAWKWDWVGLASIISIAIAYPVYGTFQDAGDNLLPLLLPPADEIDPRISAPAWRAIEKSLDRISTSASPILFHAIERSLACQDDVVYTPLVLCLDQALQKFDKTTEREHDRFIERLARDVYYLASSNSKLYCSAVKNCLCPAVKRTGVFCIRVLPLLLQAIQAGSQKKGTYSASMYLLEEVLIACFPRIKAHRGEIFTIFLRLAAIYGSNEGDAAVFHASFGRFRAALNVDHPEWIDKQLEKVNAALPELAAKMISSLDNETLQIGTSS